MRHGKDDCMWGKAIYFAIQALYSANSYAYQKYDQKQIFMGEVLIGEYKTLPQDSSLIKPPKKPNSTEEYDSVRGFTNKTDVYMVYANQKCYPRYLITFK